MFLDLTIFNWLFICCFLLSPSQGVLQSNVAGLVGEIGELPCTVDPAKCGELHSIKWYRGSSRIFVFSETANIAKAEGDFSERAEILYDQNATKSHLRINPIKVTDEMVYKCEITYIEVREGCSVVQFINFTTLIKPKDIQISRDSGQELTNSSLIGPLNEKHRLGLVCESSGGKPVPLVEWWNGSTKINGDYNIEVDSNGVGKGINKVVVQVGRGDLGAKYECRASNDALESPLTSFVELDVNVRPLKMDLSGVEHHVVQGTNVHLQCTIYGARPAANITWFNGSEPIREDFVQTSAAVKADGTYETQSSLLFTASRFENGGTLTCEAINAVMTEEDEPPIRSTLLLEVLYPPIVSVSPENITVNETTDILLFCSYEANPTSLKSVKWLRDDEEVELNPDHFEGGTADQPTLLIKNATRLDQGVYICILENNVGTSQSANTITVDVLYKPEVRVVMDPPSPVNEVDHGNVNVSCEVTSGNPDILRIVRWYLNGTILKELPECGPNSKQELCDVDPSYLVLTDVRRGFHGNYSCEGMNDAGWGPLSENAELVVHYPPGPANLTFEPKKVVKKGTLRLTCTVDDPGRPASNTYRWVRGSHLIQDITSSNWTIDPVTLETKANFTCSAYNSGGEGESSSAVVDVLAPPSFIERLPPYHGALMSSNHISLSCRVECSPQCVITWQKNGRQIDAVNSPLYSIKQNVIPPDLRTNDFESVHSTLLWNMSAWPGGQLDREYDSANYSCHSSGNIVGKGVRSITHFRVEYPPENITISSKIVSVVEGSAPEKVTCSAKAYPEASFHWRREGGNETIMKGNALILNYAMPRRGGGNYVCEAFNRHGSITGTTYINILFKPECGITQTELGGKPVLICTAHANPREVDFTWRLKTENETVDDPVENRGLQSFLTLESRVDTFRTYLCYANNSVGMGVACERDVTGKAAWWPALDNDNLLIIVAVVIGAILMFLVICVIIILVCRRKRADDKYNKPLELEERENYESYERFILNLYGPNVREIPEGNSASPLPFQPTTPVTVPTPKWPLKPGVLVHVKGARLQGTSSMSAIQASTPNVNTGGSSGSRSNRKLWALQRRRAISMTSLAQADDTSQRSRARRIKKMFATTERSESLPSGVYHGSSGVVTFRRVDGGRPVQRTVSRKRKRPGDNSPSQSATGDKLGLGPLGSQNDGLDERAFYENLPFHGMQNPPPKRVDTENTRPPSKLSSGYGSGRSISTIPIRRTQTARVANQDKNEPKFHSLRVYRKPRNASIERVATIRSTSDITLHPIVRAKQHSHSSRTSKLDENSNNEANTEKEKNCDELLATRDLEDCPNIPDRKLKPKFLYILKSKCKERENDGELCLDDNISLLSGVQRLSWSPAPTPAPRKIIPNGTPKNFAQKHTYQNVPIPISPNNSQDISTTGEKVLEANDFRLTTSQTQLIPSHTTCDLLQTQGRPRSCGRRKHDTHSLRPPRKQAQPTSNGSLKPNHVFFNSLKHADRQQNSEARRAKDRLKDQAPLQVMRFKDLLTAGGENYNRQSNSDSSGERRAATDSSSGDLETGDSRHFKNISSGEETLIRGSNDLGNREVFRPVPVLPLQSYYTPMGSDPLLLPHYAPLGSDVTPTCENLPPVYTSDSGGTSDEKDLDPLNSELWPRDSAVYSDSTHSALNSDHNRSHRKIKNGGSGIRHVTEYASLQFQDVGHEIDV